MQATVMCMYSWIYGIFGFRWRYVRLLKLLFRLTNRIFCWRSHFTEISVWKDSFCCSYQGIRPFSDAYGRTCLCVRLLHVSRYFLLSFSPPLSLSLLFAIRGRIDHFPLLLLLALTFFPAEPLVQGILSVVFWFLAMRRCQSVRFSSSSIV